MGWRWALFGAQKLIGLPPVPLDFSTLVATVPLSVPAFQERKDGTPSHPHWKAATRRFVLSYALVPGAAARESASVYRGAGWGTGTRSAGVVENVRILVLQ